VDMANQVGEPWSKLIRKRHDSSRAMLNRQLRMSSFSTSSMASAVSSTHTALTINACKRARQALTAGRIMQVSRLLALKRSLAPHSPRIDHKVNGAEVP
jgi:hypothetical protein